MERFFNLLTPIIYWCIAIIWGVIFIFYIHKINNLRSFKLLKLLLIILALDAFRSLFESVYFGSWFTSLSGYFPIAVYNNLSQPQIVIFPKILNLITAIIILILLIKRWLPLEIEENNKIAQIVNKQTSEIKEAYHELKTTEKLLKESQKKLDSIFETITFAVNLVDSKGIIIDCNHSLLAMHGYTAKEELIGQPSSLLFPDFEVERAQKDIAKILKEGTSHGLSYTLKRKDGSTFSAEISSSIFNDEAIQEKFLVSAAVDITERKRTEKELKDYRLNLEDLVQKRTKELEEKNEKLSSLNKLFVGRELRMVELKEEIEKLKGNS
ncbi:PAS domain-containing protein [Lutibacter sp.]|uniref:PAS domain-containing protein n=1 Tax=Lutibacter sp. TaxID=1925666 RepID=UPI0035689985